MLVSSICNRASTMPRGETGVSYVGSEVWTAVEKEQSQKDYRMGQYWITYGTRLESSESGPTLHHYIVIRPDSSVSDSDSGPILFGGRGKRTHGPYPLITTLGSLSVII